MATLKTANFNGSNGSHFSIRLDYSLTQNKTANTSTIEYSLYFITDKYGSGYGSAVTGYINGVAVGSCTSIGTGSTIKIGTKTETIEHNSNGTKSVNYSASMSGPWTGLGSASLSGTLALPKIDRLATLDESSLPTLITDESSIKFSYSNPAGFKVKPVITITQSASNGFEGDYITSSPYTWNWLTTDANKKIVYDIVKTSPNATARLKLNTYDSNGNFIGSTVSSTTIPFTLVNCSPTISLTCTEQNAKVKNIVGNNLILLNNASVLKVDASVTTKKNATVVEVLIQDKKVFSPYSTTYTVTGTAGNYKVNASVRDSRQLIVTNTSSNYQLVDYRPVSIDAYKFKRENPTSSKIKLNAEITYWGITLNGVANEPTISWSSDGSTYTTIPSSAYTINNTYHTITISNYEVPTTLDYQSQGTYYLKVVDKFTEDNENQIVTKGIATTEKGEHDFQVNGDLFLADESRQNKTPLNVSGNVSKNLFNAYKYSENNTHTDNVSKYSIINHNEIEISYINGWPRLVLKVTGLEPNTAYTISAYLDKSNFNTSVASGFYDGSEYKDSGFTKGSGNVYLTFTSSSTGTFDMWFYGNWSDTNYNGSIVYKNIQIEKGSTASEYEEPYEPTISIRNSNGVFQEVEINENNYSTGEQIIGTWKGKTLYRKIISKSMQPNNDNYIDTGLSNVTIVDYRAKSTPSWVNGILYNETWLMSQGICFYPNYNHSRMMLQSTASNSTDNWYFEIVLEYTKTTD